MNDFPKVILEKGKDQSLLRFHPWVFSGAIKKLKGAAEEGDTVTVYSHDNKFLGIGHVQIGSIAVRIISFEEEIPDKEFWKRKIEAAYNLRKKTGLAESTDTNVYRLIHGEGDGIPGLVADYYNGTVIFQAHSVGMWVNREIISEAIREVLGESVKAIYDKSSKTLPFKAEIEPENGYLWGEPQTNEVTELGNKFFIDWEGGQKTGFYVDQRENRKLLGRYAKDKDVLNMFCYTGGFSLYAMNGGAKKVHSVDSSVKAIELTNKNIELNFPGDKRHEAFATDAFNYLNDIDNKYNLIVLDPPSFGKHKKVLNKALHGYKKLNAKAISKIQKGGILFTFSCSQAVNKTQFREAILSAACIANRNVRILHQLTQPEDHPINIYHPAGEYLKGLVLYVD
jgi:23S rRNA (cytosine1962-C5)-methyltransferase